MFRTELPPPVRAISAFALMLAFAAPASHAAIEDYKILDWIESTSGGNQYIDTGINGQSGVYVETKLIWQSAGTGATLLGSIYNNTYQTNCTPISLSNTEGRWAYTYFTTGTVNPLPNLGKKENSAFVPVPPEGTGVVYTVRALMAEGKQVFERCNHDTGIWHTNTAFATPGVIDNGVTMYAFQQHRVDKANQQPAVCRVYYLNIYTNATAESNGVLARQFVAARERATDRVGFYDRVTDTFFPNKSTTPFYYEESGARVNVAVAPSLFGAVDPEEGELVAETSDITYTLSGAELFDDGATGYWDANRAWRAELDKAVYTPLGGTAEEITETSFTRPVGTGASVVWNFKNVKCHLTASVVGAGEVSIAGGGTSYWAEKDEVVTLTATPAAGATFTGWTGDVDGVADTTEPVIEIANTGARQLVASFVRVPSEYRVLEYIESTEGGNQYINSRIEGRTGVEVVADMMCNVHTSSEIFIGCRKGTSGNYRFYPICGTGNNAPNWAQAYGIAGQGGAKLVAGERCTVRSRMTLGTSSLTVKGATTEWARADALETGFNMYIFCCNANGGAGTFYQGRLYAMQIYTNATAEASGILARNFVPVRQRAGEEKIGLYDMVSGEFFPNVSATPFAYAENGAQIVTTADPAEFGEPTPKYGTLGAETETLDYALAGAVTFDDGAVGYWNAAKTYRAEFDKVVYTPVDGAPEEIAATNFSHAAGKGAEVVWTFKNVKCRLGSVASAVGRIVIGEREGFKWVADGETVTVQAVPDEGARFVEWIGDTNDIANIRSPSFEMTVAGSRTFAAKFVKLPSKFKALDYIESTDGGNQYIDSGIEGRSGVNVYADVASVKHVSSTVLIGCRKGTSGEYRFAPIVSTGANDPRWSQTYALDGSGGVPVVAGLRCTVVSRMTTGASLLAWLGGGSFSYARAEEPLETGFNMSILAYNINGTANNFSVSRVYSMHIFTNATAEADGVLAREFVPVLVKRGAQKGEVGLYDLVSDEFFPNRSASSTPFLYGELPPIPEPGFSVLVR